jgi:hypothetical protein
MKRLALAATGAAVMGLTACGHSSGTDAAPKTDRAPLSCTQQYRSWAQGDGKGVMGALHGVSSASTSRHGEALTAALKQARPAVAKATRHPIPACADPRGYLTVVLMHIHAAASSTGSAATTRAAVQDVPKLMHSLVVDVNQAAG